RAARALARARARRLCGIRAVDAPALSDLHAARHRPARASADQDGGDRREDRRRRAPGAARARDRAKRLRRHEPGDADAAAARLYLRDADAARRHGRPDQAQRLERADGREPGAAVLARRACHLLARGDELGRAGGEFWPDGIRPRAERILPDVLGQFWITLSDSVMPGLVPGIHVLARGKTWMAGTTLAAYGGSPGHDADAPARPCSTARGGGTA